LSPITNRLPLHRACRRIERVGPRFHRRLVTADLDDKCVDAYLAAGADALVTHDAHVRACPALDTGSVPSARAPASSAAMTPVPSTDGTAAARSGPSRRPTAPRPRSSGPTNTEPSRIRTLRGRPPGRLYLP